MAPPILKMEMKMGGLRVWGEIEPSKTRGQKKVTAEKKTHHAIGNVTNNEINCIKLIPIDFAPSDSSK